MGLIKNSWIRILGVLDVNNVFLKKKYKNNVYFKLSSNLVRFGNVGDTFVKVVLLNNGF